MAFVRKVYNGSKPPEAEIIAADCPLMTGRTALYECLTGFKDEKGKWIRGCKITMYHESGNVKVAINDPVTNQVAFGLLDPFMGLAEALDDLLSQGGLEWRNSRGK